MEPLVVHVNSISRPPPLCGDQADVTWLSSPTLMSHHLSINEGPNVSHSISINSQGPLWMTKIFLLLRKFQWIIGYFPVSKDRGHILFLLINFFLKFLGCAVWNVGSEFSNQGANSQSMQYKPRVLTTGPPGKPRKLFIMEHWVKTHPTRSTLHVLVTLPSGSYCV